MEKLLEVGKTISVGLICVLILWIVGKAIVILASSNEPSHGAVAIIFFGTGTYLFGYIVLQIIRNIKEL